MKRLHISKKNLVLFYDKHFAKIVFVIAFVCMILLYPNVGKFKYAYRSGTPWMYETLMAPFDFPILKTSAEINQEREQVANQLVSYFKEDNSIAAIKILDLQQFLFWGVISIFCQILFFPVSDHLFLCFC